MSFLTVLESIVPTYIKIITLLAFPALVWAANEAQKFQRGDCITPVVESYSWYGKYAVVEAYSSIDGFTKDKSYILAFPFSGSNSAIFSKEIEQASKKVKPSLCGK